MLYHMLSIVLATVFTTSCGQSPLLHHAEAQAGEAPQTIAADPKCPLRFSRIGLCGSITWIRHQSNDGLGAFTMRFWNADGGSALGPYLAPPVVPSVRLWMPMGHPSFYPPTYPSLAVAPARDEAKHVIPGVFEATNVYFMMGGDWEIWIQFKDGKKLIDRAKIDFNVTF